MFAVFIQNSKNYANYYNNAKAESTAAVFVVDKVLKSNAYYDKYLGQVIAIDTLKTRGRMLLNIEKDSTSLFFINTC